MARPAREELDLTRCGGVSRCATRTTRVSDSNRRPKGPDRSWSYPVMSESNLMKALVVEDEWPTRNYLVKLIQGTELAEVVGAVATIDEAREALTGSPIDVVFVDLHLAGSGGARTGLDLIRSAAESPGAPMFVIATAFEEHSLEAYKLRVLDYLLKPFTEDRVEQCLRRLAARRPEHHSGPLRVVARRKRKLIFLDPREIWAL